MKNTWIRKISTVLAITLIIQSAMGLKLFSITVKAGDKGVEEQTAGVEFIADEGVPGEEETSETETTGEGDTEESTTEEPTTEPPTEPPTTEEPTTPDYEIIDDVYKVKNNVLIEYLGDKKDKTITSLIIPAKITTIKANVFEKCQYIKKVTFEDGSKLSKIEKYAFKDCGALKTVSLPKGLKTIGYKAFGLCTSLEKFTIPGSVTYGNQIFGSSGTVKTVTFGSGIKTIPENILKNAGSVESVTIPSKITSIGKNAFYNCISLKKVSLPSTVTVLNASAFYNYIKSIGLGAFSGDKNIVLKVYANSKGKAYARANKIKWDYTDSEKKRRAANQAIYDEYTKKINAKDKKKYKLKYLSDYVPQGNCLIGKYLVVSMYHKSLSKRSVLVLYNKSTGKFAKTIVLPYRDHVGAVTNVKGRLVVSLNNISVYDYLAVYNYSKIKKVKHGKVLKPAYRVQVSGSADFAAFDGTYFWAGRSADTSYATMQGYKVKVKKKKLTFTRKYSYYVPANTQGLIVKKISKTNRRFIFSQSYGRLNNSALITYTKKISKSGGLGTPKKTLTMPSMLEGITLSSGKYMYMLYESAAGLYCGNPDNTSEIQIKDVCRIKANKLGI